MLFCESAPCRSMRCIPAARLVRPALRRLGFSGLALLAALTSLPAQEGAHGQEVQGQEVRNAQPLASPAREGDAAMLRLLTYNIRYGSARDGEDAWPARKESVAEAIREADVVGLQEVEVGQLQYLQESLPEFRFLGVGRTDGKEAGEFSPLAIRTSRFKIVHSGTYWLSPTPEQVGSRGWDAQLPRIATWAVIEDLRSGEPWGIVNTHFDHVGSEARLQSAQLIRQRTSTLPDAIPVVVLGDLNAGPDSPPLLALQAPLAADEAPGTRPLHDARSTTVTPPAGPSGTWNGFRKIDPHKRIDHVLVSSNVRVESYEVLDPRTPAGRFASDHLPIEVVLAPKSSADR